MVARHWDEALKEENGGRIRCQHGACYAARGSKNVPGAYDHYFIYHRPKEQHKVTWMGSLFWCVVPGCTHSQGPDPNQAFKDSIRAYWHIADQHGLKTHPTERVSEVQRYYSYKEVQLNLNVPW
jgi:hypothetical protein